MTVELKLDPVEEALLQDKLSHGESLEVILRRGLQAELAASSILHPPLPKEQRAAAFLAWSKSLPKRGYCLPDEALTREAIYGDHP